jgi:type VI secretion system protein ImpH
MASSSGRAPTVVNPSTSPKPVGAPASALAARPSIARPRKPAEPMTLLERLHKAGYAFDFFQAVRLLEASDPQRMPVGFDGPPNSETVRFRAHVGLSFPPSVVFEVQAPGPEQPQTAMTVTFMGLTGPNGVLPRHYTETILRLDRDTKHPEKRALAAWLDVFNHRLISLFYRSWEKYRFYIAFERGSYDRDQPDPFHQCLLSLIGLGMAPFRHRLQVRTREAATASKVDERATIGDLVLLHYAGLFAQRPHSAIGLQTLLSDFFDLPVQIQQFRGRWLQLDPADQTRLGKSLGHCGLGEDAVLGERVWETEGQFRIRVGPLRQAQFDDLLPDASPDTNHGKSFFLLCHLTRLYVGPTLDFDVQLLLEPSDVPPCVLGVRPLDEHADRSSAISAGGDGNGHAAATASPVADSKRVPGGDVPAQKSGGLHLGWNSWVHNQPFAHAVDDAVFAGQEVFWLNGSQSADPSASAMPIQRTNR